MAKGEILETWDEGDEQYSLAIYSTAPAAGGAVSSRELVDLRVLLKPEEGGFLACNTSVKDDMKKVLPMLPKGDSSLVRAFSHPGGGVRMVPSGPSPSKDNSVEQMFKYTMVSNIELNGWLLASVVNSATASALVDSHEGMLTHLESKFSKK